MPSSFACNNFNLKMALIIYCFILIQSISCLSTFTIEPTNKLSTSSSLSLSSSSSSPSLSSLKHLFNESEPVMNSTENLLNTVDEDSTLEPTVNFIELPSLYLNISSDNNIISPTAIKTATVPASAAAAVAATAEATGTTDLIFENQTFNRGLDDVISIFKSNASIETFKVTQSNVNSSLFFHHDNSEVNLPSSSSSSSSSESSSTIKAIPTISTTKTKTSVSTLSLIVTKLLSTYVNSKSNETLMETRLNNDDDTNSPKTTTTITTSTTVDYLSIDEVKSYLSSNLTMTDNQFNNSSSDSNDNNITLWDRGGSKVQEDSIQGEHDTISSTMNPPPTASAANKWSVKLGGNHLPDGDINTVNGYPTGRQRLTVDGKQLQSQVVKKELDQEHHQSQEPHVSLHLKVNQVEQVESSIGSSPVKPQVIPGDLPTSVGIPGGVGLVSAGGGGEEDEEGEVTGESDGSNGESDVYLVSNRRKCLPSRCNSIDWETVDASVMASKPCPPPYTGTAYRACYSMGHWDEPDLTECRLPHLREIQNLIFYHVHKHLVDGLYPLAEELNRLLQSSTLPMYSPMDKLDSLDSLNSILKAKVRIKLDDEDRDIPFIKSLISSSEQLLTSLPLNFPLETEKNALLTMKSVETLFGLKSLSESLLRALIVFCNDGTIHRIKSLNSMKTNIAITLTHVTPFGDHISLLHLDDHFNGSMDDDDHRSINSTTNFKPAANIFLEDGRPHGMGISEIHLQHVTNDFNTDSMILVSDIIVISVVPPISIEVNFERVPRIEIDFTLSSSTITNHDKLICGKLKSPHDLWSHKECQIVYRNLTFIKCSCSDLGIFGVVQVKAFTFSSSQQYSSYSSTYSMTSTGSIHHSQCHFNPIMVYLSSGISFILILVTMVGQLMTLRVTSKIATRKSCYILINLLISLALIEIIFLFGGPFHPSSASSASLSFSSSYPYHQQLLMPSSSQQIPQPFITTITNLVASLNHVWTPCKVISMILHYLHLVAGFTMLTYSIYLYSKLWHYQDATSNSIISSSSSSSDIITPSEIIINNNNNNNEPVVCYSDNGTLLPIIVTNSTNNINGQLQQQQQFSPSNESPYPPSVQQHQYQYHQHHAHHHHGHHAHHYHQQQYHHQYQQQHQPSIQQSQSLSSSYSSSFPSYSFFSSSPSPSLSPSSSSSSSISQAFCEKALISWNQPNLHKEPDSSRIINLLLFTWLGPAFCVVTSNIINPLGYEAKRYCWMSIEGGMMFSFIVPVSLLIMSNTVTMLLILKRFFAYKPVTHKIEIERVEPSLRSGVSLLPFFAVNWFLGVLALEDTATNIFQYLFAFCNLIQHLLVFLFHFYQRPEIHQILAIYFCNGNVNRIEKSNLKSNIKKKYWCSGNCATVPLLIYSDEGNNRLLDNNGFEDPLNDTGYRLKDL